MRCGFDILMVSFPFADSRYWREISRFKEHDFCGILSMYRYFRDICFLGKLYFAFRKATIKYSDFI